MEEGKQAMKEKRENAMEISGSEEMELPYQKQPAGIGSADALRIGVLFLAIVSFVTTANGMERYIFKDNPAVAYMSSGAIQLILLALSLNFIGFLLNIKEQKWHIFWRVVVGVFYVVLTLVTLFLSSWFSYIYIADVLHAGSWDEESELLVQQTYREELYNAQDYALAYQVYLEERLGDDIALLSVRAKELSDTNQNFADNWSMERAVYAESNSLVSPYVATVLTSMDNAMAAGATQESRDLAVVAISDARQTVGDRIETLQASVQRQQDNINNYNAQIQNITNRLNNAVEGTDVASLTSTLNTYTTMLNNATEQLSALEQENVELENVLNWLSRCSNLLGMNDSTSATSIRSKLIQLQTEFYKQNPDVDALLEIATGVFDDLQRATSSLTDGTQNQTDQYVTLMRQMNGLIQNLQDYSTIKAIENELDQMVTDLALIGREAKDSEAPTVSPEPAAPSEDSDTDAGKDDDTKEPAWKSAWRGQLEALKGQISAMPVYVETSESTNATGILSNTQRNILSQYDRNRSNKALDDMLRRYITTHNAVYQGIIYLQSTYRELAIFALILAFSFDLSGFVFSFAMADHSSSNSAKGEAGGMGLQFLRRTNTRPTEHEGWGVVKTSIPYRVLTGDFESEDGIYYYKTFKNGILSKWRVEASNTYQSGIYMESIQDGGKTGTPLPDGEQELEFTGTKRVKTDGSIEYSSGQDGIYRDCELLYKEGGLFRLVKDQTQTGENDAAGQANNGEPSESVFLASVNEYLPVHVYDPSKGESLTLPARNLAKKSIQAQVLVAALNETKTCVAAVYILQ